MLVLIVDFIRALAAVIIGRARRGPLRPSWGFRTEAAITLMRRTLLSSRSRGVPWLRKATGALLESSDAISRVRFDPVEADGVPCEWCVPADEPFIESPQRFERLPGQRFADPREPVMPRNLHESAIPRNRILERFAQIPPLKPARPV